MDSLHKTTYFDSLGKVKKTVIVLNERHWSLQNVQKENDHDFLRMTTYIDSLENIKKTVIVLTKDIEVFEM